MIDRERTLGMKITILDVAPGEEEEIIVKCHKIEDSLKQLLNRFKQGKDTITLHQNGDICLVPIQEVYYFESIDQKVFAYGKKEVYETRMKLYELEEALMDTDFLRATKSSIVNLNKIKRLTPTFSGRFEALLMNGERIVFSRQYVVLLKERLGL